MKNLSRLKTLRFFVSLLFLFQLVLMDLPVGDLQARPLTSIRRSIERESSESGTSFNSIARNKSAKEVRKSILEMDEISKKKADLESLGWNFQFAFVLRQIRIKGSNAIPTMLFAIGNKDLNWKTRLTLISMLPTMQLDGIEIMPTLVNVLEDKKDDPKVRGAVAIYALRKLKDPWAVKPLLEIAHDTSNPMYVRCSAIQALDGLNDENSIESLIQLLNDKDARVRGRAVAVLGLIGKNTNNKTMIEPLIKMLKEENNIGTQGVIIGALGSLKAKSAEDMLVKIAKDKNNINRIIAIESLGDVGGDVAKRELIRMLDENDGLIVGEVAQALTRWKDKSVIEPIKRAIDRSKYNSTKRLLQRCIEDINN